MVLGSFWYLHTMVVLFTSIKTAGAVSERARAASLVVGVPTAIGALALVGATYVYTDLFNSVLAIVCFCISYRVLPHFLGCSTHSKYKMGFLIQLFICYFCNSRILCRFVPLASWFLLLNPEWSFDYY